METMLAGLLSLIVGIVVGGVWTLSAIEREADSGVVRVGGKLYRTSPFKPAQSTSD